MDAAHLTTIVDTAIAHHAFSGVVDIRRQDTVLVARAAGYADRSNQIANTLDTRFGTASGTKFFTALAIGKLIAAQKVSFDTKLNACVSLPFPRYSPDITIRHLLTHTSGIPDYLDEETITDVDNIDLGVPYYNLRGPNDYLAVFPDDDMKFAPGARFSYSNGGYILLGVVIEALSGMRYQDFVEQQIFAPIGMHRSGFFALNRLPEQTALGYIEGDAGWRTNIYNLPIVGASDGGAFTTVHDLATCRTAFWRGEILSEALVELYATPYVHVEAEGERTTSYGHGLWIGENARGERDIYIMGGDAGVSFGSSMNRANGLQVTVISNTTEGAWPVLKMINTAVRERELSNPTA